MRFIVNSSKFWYLFDDIFFSRIFYSPSVPFKFINLRPTYDHVILPCCTINNMSRFKDWSSKYMPKYKVFYVAIWVPSSCYWLVTKIYCAVSRFCIILDAPMCPPFCLLPPPPPPTETSSSYPSRPPSSSSEFEKYSLSYVRTTPAAQMTSLPNQITGSDSQEN